MHARLGWLGLLLSTVRLTRRAATWARCCLVCLLVSVPGRSTRSQTAPAVQQVACHAHVSMFNGVFSNAVRHKSITKVNKGCYRARQAISNASSLFRALTCSRITLAPAAAASLTIFSALSCQCNRLASDLLHGELCCWEGQHALGSPHQVCCRVPADMHLCRCYLHVARHCFELKWSEVEGPLGQRAANKIKISDLINVMKLSWWMRALCVS